MIRHDYALNNSIANAGISGDIAFQVDPYRGAATRNRNRGDNITSGCELQVLSKRYRPIQQRCSIRKPLRIFRFAEEDNP